jgi:AcrR family transcriptional regulator
MTEQDGGTRRRDADATRGRILEAARGLFARDGYRATTVKRIATEAGVSPNLITRYFGGKDGLFLAVSRPEVAVGDVYVGDLDGFGERLATSIVRRWAGQAGEDPLLVLLRASGERPEAAQSLARFLDANSTHPLERYLSACGLDEADARARAAAIDALILGVTTRLRILQSELGDVDDLERWLGAAIQRLASDG